MGTKIVRKQLPLAAGGVAEGIQSKHTETENMIKWDPPFYTENMTIVSRILKELKYVSK